MNVKKMLSVITVLTLTLSGTTAMAAASKWTPLMEDQTFESETTGEAPALWSLDGAGASCVVTEEDKHTGTKGILLQNASEEEAATLSFVATGRGLETYARVEMYAWFNLTELASGGKLNFKVENTTAAKSLTGGDFTTTGKGWQKTLALYSDEYAGRNAVNAKYTIYIILTGVGKVYLDNITFGNNHGLTTNGDFEAQYSEGIPGEEDMVWKQYGFYGWNTAEQDLTLAKEGNGNTYMKFTSWGTSSYVYSRFRNLDVGQLYKLSYRTFTTSTNNANAFFFHAGLSGTPSNSITTFDSLGRVWSPKCNSGWTNHTVYFVNARNQGYAVGSQYHCDIKFAANLSAGAYAGFDDVKLEAVQEGVLFTRNGSVVTAADAGNVDITYIYPENNFTTPSQKTLISAVYVHENGVKKLYSINTVNGTASTAKVANGSVNGTKTECGFLPLTLTGTVIVPPDAGSKVYTVEAYAWNDLTDIVPSTAASILPAN